MYFAVRKGWFRGVFTDKRIVHKAIYGYQNPKYQEFFSRHMARKYVYERKSCHPIVYTDGSFRHRGKKAGYGVFFGCRDKRNLAGSLAACGKLNSQRAEAVAACVALLVTKGQIEIRTDSLHLIYRATIFPYYHNSNLDIYQALHRMCNRRHVIWTYVKAHSDDFGNTNADVLAKYGSRCQPEANSYFAKVGACTPF